ncbi:MAG: DUF2283 domain-containing protein [Planctomycetes bacterium]|nr:DUF2283 domain-containing protein [Planctomycetota bacterium]
MKAEYFEDTDTLLITFNDNEIVETFDLNENVLLETDKDGNLVCMTIEHAGRQTNVNQFAYERATVD